VVRLRIAVASVAGELGSLLAARVAGDRELGAISERTPPASSQRASRCCTTEISSTSARKRRLYCDWSGRCGNQPGNTRPTRPRNCRSELIPVAACATASATSSASLTSAGRPCRVGTRYSSAKTYAATTRASRSVISSSDLEGTQVWKPFVLVGRVPANPPDFHIKPLARKSASPLYGGDAFFPNLEISRR